MINTNKNIGEPFTYTESEIMDLLVDAHNKFMELDIQHPSDMSYWVDCIHKCQQVLKSSVVTRDYPNIFYNNSNE